MHMVDFSYAGRRLSDYGCTVASIVTSNDDSVSLGSNIIFETLKNSSTFVNRIVKVDYEDPTPVTFDICKIPFNGTSVFNDDEVSFIMQWLNKKKYEIFRPVYDDGSYANTYFKGSFNVTAIYIGGEVVGFTLTFTANSPFGYEDEQNFTVDIDDDDYDTFTFFNNSDEYGYFYPTKFVITCKSDGDFIMSNNIDINIVRINNCTNGETITLDCCNKIIQSDKSHTTLYNDFNYNYPRFVSNEESNENILTVSLPCQIQIAYSFVRKVGIIV